ncbi:uncharacterized protein LOC134838074 [Culicoides brevitarsis]|uniref:uncharacterized protein LOC134838074 n=1 Tax=Culicoides brevitarsis TaxID=469753 RepID=UPI00307B1F53
MSVQFYSNTSASSLGLVFIFNFTFFSKRNREMTRRNGSINDKNSLKNLFCTLGFDEKDIHVKEDMPKRDFFLCLHSIMNYTRFTKYRSLWIFIMTHGVENDFLYATDGPFHISEIQTALSSDTNWTGIPKILIIQACRGAETDEGLPITANFCDGRPSNVQTVDYNIPTTSDLLFFHSTWQGTASYRTKTGAPFVHYFVENMQRHFFTDDVVRIFTKVCRDVAFNFSGVTHSPQFMILKQMPCLEHSLMYKLHFGRDRDIKSDEKIQLERYKMENSQRGFVLFFYQKDYSQQGMCDRQADGDIERLTDLFSNFGYDIRVEMDKTANEAREILKNIANGDFTEVHSIIVIFSGHGVNGKLFFKEDFLYTKEIWEPFTEAKTLIGKPKLFFLSACRGFSHDKGTQGDLQLPTELEICLNDDEIATDFEAPQKGPLVIPKKADILVVFSSAADYVSIVDLKEKGTFFLLALYNEFHSLAKEENIMDIFYRVNQNLAKRITKDLKAEKQMSFVLSSLTKDLYFTPKSS